MVIARPPRGPLRPFVQLVWLSDTTRDHDPRYERERMLPSGAMHLAIRLDGPPLRVFDADGRLVVAGHAVVAGARSRFYVRDVSAPARSIGALLFPGASLPLLGVPADELAERHVALDAIWGAAAAALRQRLLDAVSPAAALDGFEAALAARLPAVRGIDPIIAHAVARLETPTPVAAIVDEIGYCHRHFVTRFRAAVGLSPKRYARVRRLVRVVPHAGTTRPWAAVAAAAGYADQAHFTRELGAIAGLTPGELRRLPPREGLHVPIEPATSKTFKPARPARGRLAP